MPTLTKKFTRDSLKRASGGCVSKESEDQPKSGMIRAQPKSTQCRKIFNEQQRRYRFLSRASSSPSRSIGSGKMKVRTDLGEPMLPTAIHPNNEYIQTCNEAELLTQMSSLTEPTWTPSIMGGSDNNSAHHSHNHQNQYKRTGNNNNFHQARIQHNSVRVFHNRATITVSTAKDHKEPKILLLNNKDSENTNFGIDTRSNNYGYNGRASTGEDGVGHEYRDDKKDYNTSIAINVKRTVKNVDNSNMRDSISFGDVVLSTPRNKHSASWRRKHEDNITSRTRGRSGRRRDHQHNKKRLLSLSSQQTTQSVWTAFTEPTSPTSSSLSLSTHTALRKPKNESRDIAYRRQSDTNKKEKASTTSRSSSVPPSTSCSKCIKRTSSMPPLISNMTKMQSFMHVSNSRKDEIFKTLINQRTGVHGHSQSLEMNLEQAKNPVDLFSSITSTVADSASTSSLSNSQSHISFSARPQVSSASQVHCPSTPSSTIEAARMSLRPRLRRSNSNRSISSPLSEPIISTAKNQRSTSVEDSFKKSYTSSSIMHASPQNTVFISRINRLAQNSCAKKIHEKRQKSRQLEMEQEQRRQKEKESLKVPKGLASASEIDDEDSCHTTVATLLIDFLFFYFLSLLVLPQRVVLYLLFKKWTARDKNVLVTGVNSSLGRETAKRFATEGSNLILVSHSTTSLEYGLDGLVEECHQLGAGKIKVYSSDLSNTTNIDLVIRKAAKDFNDTFDVIVLNGENTFHGCRFEEIADAHQIQKMITENVLGCIVPLHNSLKYIPKTSDSRIIVLSSTSGLVASPYKSVYGATQHALKGFCDSIRMELNDTYTERKAPKVCFASFSEPVAQNIYLRGGFGPRVSHMDGDIAPLKIRPWKGTSLQNTMHNLYEAIILGERDFGSPRRVKVWRYIQVFAPSLVDFSILRHFRKTQYQQMKGDRNCSRVEREGKRDQAQ